MMTQCDNCYRTVDDTEIIPLDEVKDLGQRLSPGHETPAGECRKCGALCYIKTEVGLPYSEILKKAEEAEQEARSREADERVIHLSEGWKQQDGSVRVSNWTNDNEDRGYTGYEGAHASWEITCRNEDDFRRMYGNSRVGFMGALVVVKLDGEEIRA